MEKKYYTPEIEEFHEGFSHEYKGPLDTKWHKEDFKLKGPNPNFSWFLTEGHFRVKYLDREDIESLGFYCHPTDNRIFHNKDGIILNTGWGSPVIKDRFTTVITHQVFDESKLNVAHENFLFNGIIKNKSELKRLLKQLGI